MAGHSKFANIKRKKEKNDAKRGRIFTQLGREIAIAVKIGGDDPEENSRLREVVERAKASNMPNDTIERGIKKAAGDLDSVQYEEIRYEGYGPNGVAVIVDTISDNRNRTVANVRSAFTKGAGNLGSSGSVGFLFDKKGLILIELNEDFDEDEIMEIALNASCEDFIVSDAGYEIITDPDDFLEVKKAFKDKNIEMVQAEITMRAQTNAKLTNPDDIKNMNKTLDLLEDDDDVQEIYHNWEED